MKIPRHKIMECDDHSHDLCISESSTRGFTRKNSCGTSPSVGQSVEVEAAVRSAVPRWSPSRRHRRCPWTTSLPTDRSANKWSSVCYNSVHRFSGYESISFCADLSSRVRTAACERWWSNGEITRIILHPPRTRSSRILHTNKLVTSAEVHQPTLVTRYNEDNHYNN